MTADELKALNESIEKRNAVFWAERKAEAEKQIQEEREQAKRRELEQRELVAKANQLLDAALNKQSQFASSAEIAEVVHASSLDLKPFDAGERAYTLYNAQIQRDAANGHRTVLAQIAQAFPQINQAIFTPKPYNEHGGIIDLIVRDLDRLAREKMVQIMEPHVTNIHRTCSDVAGILEKAADAKTEEAHKAFTIQESERRNQEQTAFDRESRARYLKGHDNHTLNFVPRTFTPPPIAARLVASAKALREFVYRPAFGNRPSDAPLSGALALALLGHPGGK